MRIDFLPYGPVDGVTRLSRDLLEGRSPGFPPAGETCATRLEEIVRRAGTLPAPSADRARIAEAACAYQERIGAPSEAGDAARLLTEARAAVVAAGQGPGLLGGPAMAVYKGLSAALLCRRLARIDPSRTWIPVYWNASQDHDAGEHDAAHVAVGGEVRTLRAGIATGGHPLETVVPGTLAGRVVEAFLALLPNDEARGRARAVCEPGSPEVAWGEWTSRILTRLLGRFGLVVVEPRIWDGPARPLLARAAAQAADIEGRIASRSQEIQAAGYEPSVGAAPCRVFGVFPSGRRRLAPLEALPMRLSPDVLLRPVVQGALLPVAAQVSGPSEIAYGVQATALFEALGVAAPVLVPRMSLTLVDGRMERVMRQFRLTAQECASPDADAGAIARPFVDPSLAADLSTAREAVDGGIGRIEERALGIDPALERAFRKGRARIEREMERLGERAAEASLRERGHDPGQLRFLFSMFRPGGKPQERVLNYLSLWACRDADLTDAIASAADPMEARHQVLFLD
ncbi:MAG: bacillithiol biosynthesis BshC [Planctomycetes bacterium]|nr:bacillithiol biosynthesis BshC [Planctomycetota bacterium]